MPGDAEKDGAVSSSDLDVTIAGSTAGVVSRFFIAPLDVVKIRLQLQHHVPNAETSPVYRGIIGTMRTIVRTEGVTALWKGNIPAELLYLTYGGVQFFTYRNVHLLLRSPNLPRTAEDFISGAAAGACATAATYPFDLLRTRFAAQASGADRIYHSLAHAVRDIYSHEGLSGFFRGVTAGVGQVVPYMGLFFATYEPVFALLKSASGTMSLSGYESAIAGGVASTIAKTGVFPLDVIRKRLQVQGPTRARYLLKDIPVYEGVRAIVRREGVAALYRGLGVSLVKAAPNSAITMWCYEFVLRALRDRRAARAAEQGLDS